MGLATRWGRVGREVVSLALGLPQRPAEPDWPAPAPRSSVVMLEIDNRLCLQSPENGHCFRDAQSAADYLGALSAVERLDFPYPLRAARGED